MLQPNVFPAFGTIPHYLNYTKQHKNLHFRDGPLENLWWAAGKVQKKYSRKGKLNEKNSCTPINC